MGSIDGTDHGGRDDGWDDKVKGKQVDGQEKEVPSPAINTDTRMVVVGQQPTEEGEEEEEEV